MEIPHHVLDPQWEIKVEKVINQHISKNYGLFVALMTTCVNRNQNKKVLKKLESMFSYYVNHDRSFIIDCFKNRPNIEPRLRSNIRLAILQYIARKPVSTCMRLCKQFQIGLNNGLFIYSMMAKNLPLFRIFIKKGYPRQINKGNDQVYYMINDALNMKGMPQSDFLEFIQNILNAYPKARVSCFIYLRMVIAKQKK